MLFRPGQQALTTGERRPEHERPPEGGPQASATAAWGTDAGPG